MDATRGQDRRWTALLVALAITCFAGLMFKAHCTPGGWTQTEQYTTGCYSDAIVFWGAREVEQGKLPYFQTRVEYPVLTGAAIWIEGTFVRLALGAKGNAAAFLIIVSLVNAALAFLVLRLLRDAGVAWERLWAWALSPALVLYLGHNWDMLAVAFAIGAAVLAQRGQLVTAAAVAGLGAAAKMYPALLLPLLGLQALFERDRSWRERLTRAAMISAAAIGAWAAVNLPVALAAFENWSEFYRFSQERGGTAGATWDVLRSTGWATFDDAERNRYAMLAFFTGFAVIVGFGWQRHRDRLWLLFTPLLAWFLLTNKVWSPQFDLWLYPLLLLTVPRLWPVALFALGDVAAYFAEFWWFAGMEGVSPSATPTHIAIAAAFRGAAMLWIITDCLRLVPPEWTLPFKGNLPLRQAQTDLPHGQIPA
jgi:uncharacterized membrane protein